AAREILRRLTSAQNDDIEHSFGLNPAFVSARQRDEVLESHLFHGQSGQGRAASASTIQDNLLVLVGRDLVDVYLQLAARDIDRAGDHTFGGFVFFAYISQH